VESKVFLSEKRHKPALSIINGDALFSPTLGVCPEKFMPKLPFGGGGGGRPFKYAYIYLQFNEHYFNMR
jgi:hypothetical protein